MGRNNSLSSAKIVILMMFFTLFTKFAGFIREMLLGQKFGTSYETDAYIIALTVPTVIFSSILAAITTTYIPIYTKIKNKSGLKRANYFTSNLLSLITLISFILIVVGICSSELIVKVIGRGLSNEALELANSLTKISLFMLIFLGIISILTVYLQAESKFIIPAFINIPIITVVIIALSFGNYIGIKGVMFSNIIGSLIQVLILIIAVYRIGYKFKPTFDIKDKNIKEMITLVVPVLIGTSIQQINFLIDRMLASSLGEGIISALTFGSKINEMFFGLISVTIATFIFPQLSQLAANKSMKEYDKLVRTSLNTVSILVFPVVFIVLSYSTNIVKILFERGAFDQTSTTITSNALFYYSIGMLFFGFRDVLNRSFYSLGDTKTPMKNSIIGFISNIVMSITLMNFMGYKGIALATSLAGVITTLLLFTSFSKKVKEFKYKLFFIDQLKVFLASVIMIVISLGIYNWAESLLQDTIINNILFLAISIILGAIVYILILMALKLEEITLLINKITNKIRYKS
ncbi:murein biosynthesis integral membrane protein MurJ [Metabacillus halosaccharovorans]|uniref:murein biosynthesis integral membrane protein MurJ n=1 Tax=Metabacillus halosaccharovorans TaxID=930124 RepID=UPI001C1FD18E|nr:murein biosynthesis integral membrane protein MurJ [Metabacillus halosaccharovorans]MBU7594461.1 murein biosynthesis integral membrane protein MurJ [Metabacillus halosaccharovorans]